MTKQQEVDGLVHMDQQDAEARMQAAHHLSQALATLGRLSLVGEMRASVVHAERIAVAREISALQATVKRLEEERAELKEKAETLNEDVNRLESAHSIAENQLREIRMALGWGPGDDFLLKLLLEEISKGRAYLEGDTVLGADDRLVRALPRPGKFKAGAGLGIVGYPGTFRASGAEAPETSISELATASESVSTSAGEEPG